MVTVEIDDESHTGQIVLQPNYSWSWQSNLYLLYTLMGISLSIGVAFLFMGAWVILPYSILEMLFLLICMYYCVLQCSKLEVITVSQHDVCIEKGIRSPSERWDYKRLWAKFLVQSPRHPWDTAIVSIRSHGNELEIGSFLNRRDKQELIAQLKRVVPA